MDNKLVEWAMIAFGAHVDEQSFQQAASKISKGINNITNQAQGSSQKAIQAIKTLAASPSGGIEIAIRESEMRMRRFKEQINQIHEEMKRKQGQIKHLGELTEKGMTGWGGQKRANYGKAVELAAKSGTVQAIEAEIKLIKQKIVDRDKILKRLADPTNSVPVGKGTMKRLREHQAQDLEAYLRDLEMGSRNAQRAYARLENYHKQMMGNLSKEEQAQWRHLAQEVAKGGTNYINELRLIANRYQAEHARHNALVRAAKTEEDKILEHFQNKQRRRMSDIANAKPSRLGQVASRSQVQTMARDIDELKRAEDKLAKALREEGNAQSDAAQKKRAQLAAFQALRKEIELVFNEHKKMRSELEKRASSSFFEGMVRGFQGRTLRAMFGQVAREFHKAFQDAGGGLAGMLSGVKAGGAMGLGFAAVAAPIKLLTSSFKLAMDAGKGLFNVLQRGLGTLRGLVQGAAQSYLEVRQFAMATGMAVDAAQEIHAAFKAWGMDTHWTAVGLEGLNKAVMANNKAITSMGIATRDAQGNLRAVNDVLKDMRELYKSLDEEGRRNMVGNLQTAMPFLAMIMPLITGDMDKTVETLKALNAVLDETESRSMAKVVGSMQTLSAVSKGLANTISVALAPAFEKIANIIANVFMANIDRISGVFDNLTSQVLSFVNAVTGGGLDKVNVVQQLTDGMELATAAQGKAMRAYQDTLDTAAKDTQGLTDDIEELNVALEEVNESAEALREEMEGRIEVLNDIKETLTDELEDSLRPLEAQNDLLEAQVQYWNRVKAAASAALDTEIQKLQMANQLIAMRLKAKIAPLNKKIKDLQDQKEVIADAKKAAQKAPKTGGAVDEGAEVRGEIDELRDSSKDLDRQIKGIRDAGDAYEEEQRDKIELIDDAKKAIDKQVDAIERSARAWEREQDVVKKGLESQIKAFRSILEARRRQAQEQEFFDRRAYLMGQTLLAQAEARARSLSARQARQRQSGETDTDYQIRMQELSANEDIEELRRQDELTKLNLEEQNFLIEQQIQLIQDQVDIINEAIELRNEQDELTLEGLRDQKEALDDQIEAYRDLIEARNDADDAAIKVLEDQKELIDEQIEGLNEVKEGFNSATSAAGDLVDVYEEQSDALDDQIEKLEELIALEEERARIATAKNDINIDHFEERKKDMEDFYEFFQGNVDAEKIFNEMIGLKDRLKDINIKLLDPDISEEDANALITEMEGIFGQLIEKQGALADFMIPENSAGISGIEHEITLNEQLMTDRREAHAEQMRFYDEEIEKVKELYKPQLDGYKDQMDELRDQIKIKQQEIRDLQQEVKDAQAVYDDSTDDVKTEQEKLDALKLQLGVMKEMNEQSNIMGRNSGAWPGATEGLDNNAGAKFGQWIRETFIEPWEGPDGPKEAIKKTLSNLWKDVGPLLKEGMDRAFSEFGDLVWKGLQEAAKSPHIVGTIAIALALQGMGVPLPFGLILGAAGVTLIDKALDNLGMDEFVEKVWGALVGAAMKPEVLGAIAAAVGLLVVGIPLPLGLLLGAASTAIAFEVADDLGIGKFIDKVWDQFTGGAGGKAILLAALGTGIALQALGVPLPLGILLGYAAASSVASLINHWDDITGWLDKEIWQRIKKFFGETLPKFKDEVTKFFGGFYEGAEEKMDGLLDWLQEHILDIILIMFFPPAYIAWKTGGFEMMVEFFAGMWDKLKEFPGWLKEHITDILLIVFFPGLYILWKTGGLDAMIEFFAGMWEKIKNLGTWLKESIWDPINNFFTGDDGLISKMAGWGKSAADGLINAFKAIPGGLQSAISKIWDKISAPLRTAWDGFAGFINGIKDIINGIADKLGVGITLPGLPPFPSPPSYVQMGPENPDAMATGGRVGGRTVAEIGEAGFPEYVITTDPKHKNRTQGLLEQFLQEAPFIGGMYNKAMGGWNPIDGIGNGVGAIKDAAGAAIDLGADGFEWVINQAKDKAMDLAIAAMREILSHMPIPDGFLRDMMVEAGEYIFDQFKGWFGIGRDKYDADHAFTDLSNIFKAGGSPSQSYGMTSFAATGIYGGGPHTGVDVSNPMGTPLYAPAASRVSNVQDFGGLGTGKTLTLEVISNQMRVLLGHLSDIVVSIGEEVTDLNKVVAHVGSTGKSTGPHTHVEVRDKTGSAIDPGTLLPQWASFWGSDLVNSGGVQQMKWGGLLRPNSTIVDSLGRPYATAAEGGISEAITPMNVLRNMLRDSWRDGQEAWISSDIRWNRSAVTAINGPAATPSNLGGSMPATAYNKTTTNGNTWTGDIIIDGAQDPEAVAKAVKEHLSEFFGSMPKFGHTAALREVR